MTTSHMLIALAAFVPAMYLLLAIAWLVMVAVHGEFTGSASLRDHCFIRTNRLRVGIWNVWWTLKIGKGLRRTNIYVGPLIISLDWSSTNKHSVSRELSPPPPEHYNCRCDTQPPPPPPPRQPINATELRYLTRPQANSAVHALTAVGHGTATGRRPDWFREIVHEVLCGYEDRHRDDYSYHRVSQLIEKAVIKGAKRYGRIAEIAEQLCTGQHLGVHCPAQLVTQLRDELDKVGMAGSWEKVVKAKNRRAQMDRYLSGEGPCP